MSIHVFDAYGTLLDVHAPLKHLKDRIGAEAEAVSRHLRVKQLEYTWVRTLGGFAWRNFRALTADALDHALAAHGITVDDAFKADFIALYDRLDAFPDVPAALRRLKRQGARLAILSNGTRDMLAAACAAAGIASDLDAVISVDAIERFKTAREVYELATARFSAEPADIAFYSSNRWDVAAGTAFGFVTTWVNRAGAPDEYPELPPVRVVRSLAEI